MRIVCYRKQHELDGVSVLSLSTADVPVPLVLERALLDVTLGDGVDGSEASALADEQAGPQQSLYAPQRFRYRVGEMPCGQPHDGPLGEEVEANGLVLGSGDGSLLAFFEYRFIPDVTSDRMVDRLYFQRMGDEITRSDWVRAMESEVLGRDRQRSFRRLRNELGIPPRPHFIGYQGETPGCLTELHDEQGRFYVLAGSDETPHAVVVPYEERVGDDVIPRWRFAIMGEYERGVGSWDGRRYRIAGSFEELPKSIQCALERDGQSLGVPTDWLVPLGDLRPEALVRVPYRSEVADLVEAGPSPRQAGLGRPAFLVDTRRPVELRGAREIDVVSDPEVAVAVISRQTVRGVYVPTMPPAPLSDLALSPEGQPARFLAACWI